MPPRFTKSSIAAPTLPASSKPGLGNSPAALLSKRISDKKSTWCPKPDLEYDPYCDLENPKTITYKDVKKAAANIKEEIPCTPLKRSRCCVQLGLEMNYKIESQHRTGSFHERGALYALQMLTLEERQRGISTASLGNWAMALAYHGKRMDVKITVVLPVRTQVSVVDFCREFGATVVLHGEDLTEAKKQAFVLRAENGSTYINGYDHPDVIAAAGTIGLEILEQLPQTDAILVPVGGGGLLAGVAAAVKHVKPEVLIYGFESDKCCSFFKATESEEPYITALGRSVATSLAVPMAGQNAFQTAKSLISKLVGVIGNLSCKFSAESDALKVLVDDDWIARAVLHYAEEERMIVEGAGAITLGPLLTQPRVLPELLGKTVVCIVSGGNIDNVTLPRCFERAKALEGRLIKLTVTVSADDMEAQRKVLSVIANVGCNLLKCYSEHAWLLKNDLHTIYLNLIVETRGLEHACSLKRVMEKLFPDMCEFLEDPFSPIPICVCFPKKLR